MVLSFLVATASAAMVDREPNGCTIDTAQVLALPEADFDQGEKGWRILARPGCFLAAADVIASYRTAHPGHGHMLYFHEAQMRAAGNDYEGAAPCSICLAAGPMNGMSIPAGTTTSPHPRPLSVAIWLH